MKRTLAIGAAVLVSAFVIGQQIRVELQATLVGNGKGRAVWKQRDAGTRLQAELQVEAEGLARNTPFTVNIGPSQFAVTTDVNGTFKLDRRYTTASRPSI